MAVKDLSIIILTNRSDQRFINSLRSAQVAQEVLVIDNLSSNNWSKLKTSFRFRVLKHDKPITNFAQVRNASLKEVKTNWVLFLDSDEVLSKKAELEIEQIIKNNFYQVVSIKRVDYFLGKPLNYGEAGTTYLTRLFKPNSAKFVRNVHETLNYQGKLGQAQFIIKHYSHNSIKEFFEKIAFYAKLEAKNKSISHQNNLVQMISFPIGKFIFNYFIKLGFLDGYRGLIYATLMSLHSFFVRVYYYEEN